MIIGIGIDVVDVPRFRAQLSDFDAAACFLPAEIDYCRRRARPWESLAARAAAKRALLRALPGDRGAAEGASDLASLGASARELWRGIEVVRRQAGAVDLRLTGRALEAVEAAGVTELWISLSHTKHTALAAVMLEAGSAVQRTGRASCPSG